MEINLQKYRVVNRATKEVARCWYSRGHLIDGRDCVTVTAKDYGQQLSRVFPPQRVENQTDTQTDYFDKDRVRIFPGDALWADACARAVR